VYGLGFRASRSRSPTPPSTPRRASLSHQPSDEDQIAGFRSLISTGACRNSATCGENQDDEKRRFDPTLWKLYDIDYDGELDIGLTTFLLSLSLSLSLSHSPSLSLSLFLTLSHLPTLSLESLSLSPTHSLSHSLSPSLTLSLALSLTLRCMTSTTTASRTSA